MKHADLKNLNLSSFGSRSFTLRTLDKHFDILRA